MKHRTKAQLEVELETAKNRIAFLEQTLILTEKVKTDEENRRGYFQYLSDRLLSILESGAKEGKFPR